MDLREIEQNIDDFVYRCFEAFLADVKWIEHNVKVHRQLGTEMIIFSLKIETICVITELDIFDSFRSL